MSSTDTPARPGAPDTATDAVSPETTLPETALPEIAWKQADEGVFVATHDGEFAGFVAVERQTHVVHDRHSRRIGSFATLADARQALADATRPPSRGRERLRRRILTRRR